MALGELLDYEQPTKYLVKSVEYDESYETSVLTAGQTFILGHTNEKEGIYSANLHKPVIIFDDFTTAFQWVDFSFKVKSSALKILTPNHSRTTAIMRYVYYAMQTITYKPQVHARQWIATYSNFRIPIPPVEEQKRIVAILDKFDSLTNDLSSGLPAEIKARRKQYEYYRNKLLTFKEAA